LFEITHFDLKVLQEVPQQQQNSVLLVLMGVTGLELKAVTTCNTNNLHNLPDLSGAESGAVLTTPVPSDSDLQFLIASWAKLPETIKSGILAIVNGSIDKLEAN